METATLTQLRLTEFKSFSKEVLDLQDLTILIGRNGAGKSNALDGLEVLSRMMGADDLVEALDGRRRGTSSVRGGSRGLPPHGSTEFALGCTVQFDGCALHYDVRVQVEPTLQILSEKLVGPGKMVESGNWHDHRILFETVSREDPQAYLEATIHNGRRGRQNPIRPFRDNRPILAQIITSLPGDDVAERSVLQAAEAVRSALRSIFHLDPVPHLMRDYVAPQDSDLSRTADNLSAAAKELQQEHPERFARLTELIQQVADSTVEKIDFIGTDLNETMLCLQEKGPGAGTSRTPAREISDGLLRFIAVAISLLAGRNLDVDALSPRPITTVEGDDAISGEVLLVIEELENGLHPSQAGRVLELLRSSAEEEGKRVLLTTNNPALLNRVRGDLNRSVTVCHRDAEGRSRLTPLVDMPDYLEAAAGRGIGTAISDGMLNGEAPEEPDYTEFDRLIGIG